MLVTDRFIYIHQPKTGGTFVHDVLFKVFNISWSWYHGLVFLATKKVVYNTKHGTVIIGGAKHDNCAEVDLKWLEGRRFLSNVRNPLDQYVSQYEFGWWKRKEYLKYYQQVSNFTERFPTFPDLSFDDFMKLEYDTYNDFSNDGLMDEKGIGLQSVRFIRYFMKDAQSVLERISSNGWQLEEIKEAMYPVDFLRTDKLNQDLYEFLLNQDFSREELSFVLNKEKVLPLGKGRTKEQKWQKYYTPELLETVLRKDKLIFDLFPEFIPKSL